MPCHVWCAVHTGTPAYEHSEHLPVRELKNKTMKTEHKGKTNREKQQESEAEKTGKPYREYVLVLEHECIIQKKESRQSMASVLFRERREVDRPEQSMAPHRPIRLELYILKQP